MLALALQNRDRKGVALLLAIFLLPFVLQGQQDERRVASPNAQLEFRLFVAQPDGALFSRIGYQVFFRGKPLITTSWLGLDIRDQEPFLGENPGFMSSEAGSGDHYNSLVARYMQNGSLGRRLDVEVRAYDDGVAFRYVIPKSTPLEDILIRDEATEFNFAQPGLLSHLAAKPDFDLPFEVHLSGSDWLALAVGPESASSMYPKTYLVRTDTGMRTSLARSKTEPSVAFAGKTPLTWPWRVVLVGPDPQRLIESDPLNLRSK
jgi:alpha-glucosidase